MTRDLILKPRRHAAVLASPPIRAQEGPTPDGAFRSRPVLPAAADRNTTTIDAALFLKPRWPRCARAARRRRGRRSIAARRAFALRTPTRRAVVVAFNSSACEDHATCRRPPCVSGFSLELLVASSEVSRPAGFYVTRSCLVVACHLPREAMFRLDLSFSD
jgi:hypothetical protein